MRDLKNLEILKTLSMPLKEFLVKNFNQHCAIIINADGVKVVQDEMYAPLPDDRGEKHE